MVGLALAGVSGFQLPSSTRSVPPSQLAASTISLQDDENAKIGARFNARVRAIMDLLTERYKISQGFSTSEIDKQKETVTTTTTSSNEEWTKLRSFLYRATASDRGLTIEQVNNVLAFLHETFPDHAVERSILLRSPRILTKNVRTRLRPTVDFLQSLYGDEIFLNAVTRNPDLLLIVGTGYEGDEVDAVELYLRKELLLSSKNISQLKKSAPAFLKISMKQLVSTVKFFRGILEYPQHACSSSQRPEAIIGKLVLAHHHIFQLSVDANLKPRIQYLIDRCSLQDSDLAALLKSSSGAILGLSISENLKPTLDLLSGVLSPSDLRKSVLSHPQILGLSLQNLRSKIAYFDTIDDFHGGRCSKFNDAVDPSLASRVLVRSTAAFSLSLRDNIIPKIEFLARIWGTSVPDLDDRIPVRLKNNEPMNEKARALASLLSEFPSILTLSLEGNIKPTVNFYVQAGYLTLDSDGKLAPFNRKYHAVRGRYIAASLFTRLLPRWHYYSKYCDPEDFAAPSLHLLAGTTDEGFCGRFGFDVLDYAAFKNEAVPRLKFNSQFDTWIHTGRPIDD